MESNPHIKVQIVITPHLGVGGVVWENVIRTRLDPVVTVCRKTYVFT
jgi:hypothetical protein